VPDDIPNARYAGPGADWRKREYPPKHAAVWIRMGGAWLEGLILRWKFDPGMRDRWECVIEAEVPGIPGRIASYVFDERSIRPRYGPHPPAGSAHDWQTWRVMRNPP